MNTLRPSQSHSLPVKNRLARKLHPSRHPKMSPLLAAIVGYVIDASFCSPRIVEIVVTPDRVLLVRPEGEVSPVPVGRYDDLLPAWSALLSAARLKDIEHVEALALFAQKIGFVRAANA